MEKRMATAEPQVAQNATSAAIDRTREVSDGKPNGIVRPQTSRNPARHVVT
jgi:hypothetical protein